MARLWRTGRQREGLWPKATARMRTTRRMEEDWEEPRRSHSLMSSGRSSDSPWAKGVPDWRRLPVPEPARQA
eukprot:2529297-Pyramimonas_sp.AAC.1